MIAFTRQELHLMQSALINRANDKIYLNIALADDKAALLTLSDKCNQFAAEAGVGKMTVAELLDHERNQRSTCCKAHVEVVYYDKKSRPQRTAVAYTCSNCLRLYVADSRDDQKEQKS